MCSKYVSVAVDDTQMSCSMILSQVYDRCRGIDNDPVEPDPIPARVSTQLSLFPLIRPAYALGKPGEVR